MSSRTLEKARPVITRGLRLEAAAAWVGVGSTKFLQMVTDGRMPRPRCIDSVRVWDVRELEVAFDDLPAADENRGWSHGDD